MRRRGRERRVGGERREERELGERKEKEGNGRSREVRGGNLTYSDNWIGNDSAVETVLSAD